MASYNVFHSLFRNCSKLLNIWLANSLSLKSKRLLDDSKMSILIVHKILDSLHVFYFHNFMAHFKTSLKELH